MKQNTFHNPDRFVADLRQILSQGRKRIGFLIGAGAPKSILVGDDNRITTCGVPLIPDVKALTKNVLAKISENNYKVIEKLFPCTIEEVNIETILTRLRRLSEALEKEKIHGLNGEHYQLLAEEICQHIGTIVERFLPVEPNPYLELTAWIGGTSRDHAVEIFTPNYDLLLEEAFETNRFPYFDGFSGSYKPFFDPTSINSDNNLPARWSRIWKLHGSLGWEFQGENIIRTGNRKASSLIFPDHLKYDQIEKQPYTAMFERLKSFLNTPDSLLICTGFSFSDAHISAIFDEALAANTHTAIFAFQYGSLADETSAKNLALRRRNMSVYARDGGVISNIEGEWLLGAPPTEEWKPIRTSFWNNKDNCFLLGDFSKLARFIALTHADILADFHEDSEEIPYADDSSLIGTSMNATSNEID